MPSHPSAGGRNDGFKTEFFDRQKAQAKHPSLRGDSEEKSVLFRPFDVFAVRQNTRGNHYGNYLLLSLTINSIEYYSWQR